MRRHTPGPRTQANPATEPGESAVAPGVGVPIDPSVRSSLEELVPALPREAAVLRRNLTAWLAELPLDQGSRDDVVLATYEALANVAAHAYPEQRGWTRLYAEWAGDTVRVTVTDTGCGIPPKRARAAVPSASGGRGLRLIDEAADRMTVDTGAHGTRVTMVWRPAALRRGIAS